jgi:hypothetical protein
MRGTARVVAAISILAAGACQRVDEELANRANRDDEKPASLAGNARDFGISIISVWLKNADGLVDARFEVQNRGRSIVNVRTKDAAAGSEAVLSVEVFRDGTWEKEKSATGDAPRFVDLWPGATVYARTTIPHGVRWARVLVSARGLVGMKDGITVDGAMDVASDAFEIPRSD